VRDEGRARRERALERPREPDPARLARALLGLASLAWTQGDMDGARRHATAAIRAAAESNATEDEISARNVLGTTALSEKDFETARRHFEPVIVLAERFDLPLTRLSAKLNLGVVALDSGDAAAAVPIFEELLAENQAAGVGVAFPLMNLGLAAFELGDDDAARDRWEDARAAFAEFGFRAHVGHALQGLAAVEARAGNAVAAATLLGRADSELAGVGHSPDDFNPRLAAEAEAQARPQLGDEAFTAAYEEGRRAVDEPAAG